MKQGKLIVWLALFVVLQGCVAGMIAAGAAGASGAGYFTKHALSAKPKMVYTIEGRDIVMSVTSYSSNIGSIQDMTELGAAMVASEQKDCDYLLPTFNTWPKSMVILKIKVKAIATFKCIRNSANAIDVQKIIAFEASTVQLIRERKLLTAAVIKLGDNPPATQGSSEKTQKSATNLISTIQRQLNNLGYKAGSIDGIMGHNTKNAIRSFQADNNIEVTGEPSESLLSALTKQQR